MKRFSGNRRKKKATLEDAVKFLIHSDEEEHEHQHIHEEDKEYIQVENNHMYLTVAITVPVCFELIRKMRDMKFELEWEQRLLEIDKPRPMHIHICSTGGGLLPAFGVADVMKQIGNIHTHIEGAVASAATIISMAGSHRTITKSSSMMLHQLSVRIDEADYTATDIEELHEGNQIHMDQMIQFYLDNSKYTEREKLEEILKRDTWFPSKDCLELGFVDEIV